MTEYVCVDEINNTFVCRTCLKTDDLANPMTTDEENLFVKLVPGVMKSEAKSMHVCKLCNHFLKKIMNFVRQCQIANKVWLQIDKDSAFYTPVTSCYNLIQTTPDVYSTLEWENGKMVDVKSEDLYDFNDDTFVNDDEIPLILLKSDGDKDADSIRKNCKPKKKIRMKNKNINYNFDTSLEIVSSRVSGEPIKYKKNTQIKEGFTSRMVQETNEYIVIKLTKQQVLEEMNEKLKSDKFQRAPFKCEKCVKGFNFEDVLNNHMEKHSMENGEFTCDICYLRCPNKVSLRGHLKSHTTRYKCKVCGCVRVSRQQLVEHHALAHTAAPHAYSCHHCAFTTNKRTMIQRHVRRHAASAARPCHRCGKTFKNVESLRVHTIRHDTSRTLQCEHCNRKFIYPSLLQKHVQAVHVNKDYYCVECDVRFKSPENLKLHFIRTKKHRDVASFKHSCACCEERYWSAGALAAHAARAHGAARRLSCARCARRYASRDALRAHTRRAHASAGYTCDVCGNAFTSASTLSTHMQRHAVLNQRHKQKRQEDELPQERTAPVED